ncbi:MAG: hypothetical protein ACYCW6_12485 [Candidatus Xenobia bacterium]
MMPIKKSRHAKNQMRLYNVSDAEVVEVLDSPDRMEPSIKGRTNAIRMVAGRRIRVTYIVEGGEHHVITVNDLDKK